MSVAATDAAIALDSGSDLWSYFDVADEIDGGLALDDLDGWFVDEARAFADRTPGAPWPPHLPWIEEHVLDLRQKERIR